MAVQKGIETFGESSRAARRLQCIADRHLFKREYKIRAGLNPDGLAANLEKLSLR